MATVSFSTKFDLTLTPKQFVFEDTTDYVGQGIALADVNGSFKITSPSGTVIYNNVIYTTVGCDIYIDNDLENQTTISLPVLGDIVESGTYTIVYTVYDSNASEYYTVTNSYDYQYEAPEVEITQTVDCISPLFTSIDSTNYVVDGITPSIIREHIVAFPLGSGLSPESGASATMAFGSEEFANGTQSTEISSTVEYTFADGLVVRDLIEGVQEFVVDCTYICAIYCCIRSIEQQMVAAKGVNDLEYKRLSLLFAQIMGFVSLAKLAIKCGKSTDVAGYLAQIQLLGNCTDDCSCSGTEPSLVTGLNGLVNTVVVNAGSANVTVEGVTVGNTTTYTVNLGGAFVALVNSLYNTVVVAGTGVTVADSGIIANVRTFTITNPNSDPVLHNDTTQNTTANAAMTVLKSYTLPINKLPTDGSSLELIAIIDTNLTLETKAFDIRIGGTVCHAKSNNFRLAAGEVSGIIKAVITRQSATTLFIQFVQLNSFDLSYVQSNGKVLFETGFVVANLTSNTTLIEVRGQNVSAGAELARLNQLMITYSKK